MGGGHAHQFATGPARLRSGTATTWRLGSTTSSNAWIDEPLSALCCGIVRVLDLSLCFLRMLTNQLVNSMTASSTSQVYARRGLYALTTRRTNINAVYRPISGARFA